VWNIWSSIHLVCNVQHFLKWQWIRVYASLWCCSHANRVFSPYHITGWKLHTYTIWSESKICTEYLKATEVKAEQLPFSVISHCVTLPVLIMYWLSLHHRSSFVVKQPRISAHLLDRHDWFIDWLIDTWVWCPTSPMHLGLKETSPLCPKLHSWQPCCLAKEPNCPQALALDVLWFQTEGA
jgi:hypothetical protein